MTASTARPLAASPDVIRIGNCSGFYGDRFSGLREMLDGGDLDVVTGDYLVELTMLILGRDRRRDPDLGYRNAGRCFALQGGVKARAGRAAKARVVP